MIQVFLGNTGAYDVEGNELPRLVYVSREKRPGYQHHKKAGAEPGRYGAWGPLFRKVFFAFWVILHLHPFLRGLMGRQNRTPTIVVLWPVLLASVFSFVWVKIGPFVSTDDASTMAESCIWIDC